MSVLLRNQIGTLVSYGMIFLHRGKDIVHMESQIESVADIEATLLKLIKRSGGEDGPTRLIAAETIPYRDVDGFDSLTALEVLTELEEETGIHVEEDVFYLDTKTRK